MLRDCGETHETVETRLTTSLALSRPMFRPRPCESPRLNPRAYEILGRAQGFAAAAGADEPEPEHLLLAILWERVTAIGFPPVRRAEAYARLRELGAYVPPAPLPPDDLPCWGEDVAVPIDWLMDVVRALPTALPAGAHFGFNHDGENEAWVVADAHVDLEPIVERILAASS